MNSGEMRFVQNAAQGSDEKGYSRALVDVDGDRRGMEVRAAWKSGRYRRNAASSKVNRLRYLCAESRRESRAQTTVDARRYWGGERVRACGDRLKLSFPAGQNPG